MRYGQKTEPIGHHLGGLGLIGLHVGLLELEHLTQTGDGIVPRMIPQIHLVLLGQSSLVRVLNGTFERLQTQVGMSMEILSRVCCNDTNSIS